jgi:hypothetical protein
MKLQGNFSTTSKRRAVKGAIWKVLPVYDDLLKGFEEARERHLPADSQRPRSSSPLSLLPPPPPTRPIQPPTTQRSIRRSQGELVGKASASTEDSTVVIELSVTQVTKEVERINAERTSDFATSQLGARFLSLEHHFNHNINAVWQKLERYYNLTDDTPVYRAAVFLHLRMEWRWFEKY